MAQSDFYPSQQREYWPVRRARLIGQLDVSVLNITCLPSFASNSMFNNRKPLVLDNLLLQHTKWKQQIQGNNISVCVSYWEQWQSKDAFGYSDVPSLYVCKWQEKTNSSVLKLNRNHLHSLGLNLRCGKPAVSANNSRVTLPILLPRPDHCGPRL